MSFEDYNGILPYKFIMPALFVLNVLFLLIGTFFYPYYYVLYCVGAFVYFLFKSITVIVWELCYLKKIGPALQRC